MKQIERERVFLVKQLPVDIIKHQSMSIQVGDFFDSNAIDALKIRRKGENYHLIKKEANTVEKRIEHIINIKKEEFDILIKCTVQSHRKNRYFYPSGDYECEIDYYLDRLDGYVREEVEFVSDKHMNHCGVAEWFGEETTAINHEIHENLGIVTFAEMEERYKTHGISLKKIVFPSSK